jgi:glutamate--cysteine ligase
MMDWEDHMTTSFPEVRLKQFLEMRGADGGPWRRLCALPALWAGLLYDQSALDAAWALCSNWSMDERLKLRSDAAKLGLKAEIRGRSLQDVSMEVLEFAHHGLSARNRLNSAGDNETGFLLPLQETAESGSWRFITVSGKDPSTRYSGIALISRNHLHEHRSSSCPCP